jgi:hypothetical protein
MLAEVSRPIGGEDLKLHLILIKVFWRECLPLKQAWLSCKIQAEFT